MEEQNIKYLVAVPLIVWIFVLVLFLFGFKSDAIGDLRFSFLFIAASIAIISTLFIVPFGIYYAFKQKKKNLLLLGFFDLLILISFYIYSVYVTRAMF